MPALRISPRSNPRSSCRCSGTVRTRRLPAFTSVTGLPCWRTFVHPLRWNARMASAPERSGRGILLRLGWYDRSGRKVYPDSDNLERRFKSDFAPGQERSLDGLADIIESFVFGPSLRNAARQGRTFGHDKTVLSGNQRDQKFHGASHHLHLSTWVRMISNPKRFTSYRNDDCAADAEACSVIRARAVYL